MSGRWLVGGEPLGVESQKLSELEAEKAGMTILIIAIPAFSLAVALSLAKLLFWIMWIFYGAAFFWLLYYFYRILTQKRSLKLELGILSIGTALNYTILAISVSPTLMEGFWLLASPFSIVPLLAILLVAASTTRLSIHLHDSFEKSPKNAIILLYLCPVIILGFFVGTTLLPVPTWEIAESFFISVLRALGL